MAEVDDAFLGEIESWRALLAQELAQRNPTLTVQALSSAVQQLIDRIVFLRMAEARGTEDFGQLRDIAAGENIYQELLDVFYRADARYNSGVFHFSEEAGREAADTLAPKLNVSDEPLRRIITHLYYPESPYEFTVLPGRILGQVYERFLGSEITITPTRQVSIRLKPEFARAGGVYYTPGYIADRIIERSIGELLDVTSRTARADASRLRVVDPACGSGSFLLSAYDYLLNWHRDYYMLRGPARFRAEMYQAGDEWRLTIAERKRILMTHIFGVDIDPQAVEVTKLSLLLKVLEGESAEVLGQLLTLFNVRVLPDLDANIKCGNSLAEDDVFNWVPQDLYSGNEPGRQLRPFNWTREFPQAFNRDNPGFDVVVGNPPYVSAITMVQNLQTQIRDYWRDRYQSAAGAYDIYILFVEQGIRLCRQGGRLSYIIPNKFLAAEYAVAFRQLIYDTVRFAELVDYSRTQVWRRGVYPVVPLLINSRPQAADQLAVSRGDPEVKSKVHPLAEVPRSVLGSIPDHLWSFVTRAGVETLERIIQQSRPLDSWAELTGTSTVAEGSEFPAALSSLAVGQQVPGNAAKFLITGSIGQFEQRWATRQITYMHQQYYRPVLGLEDPVPARRRTQARAAKLIIAKVSIVPKAFADHHSEFAAAYCTYVFPQEGISLRALAGVLNSNVVAFASRLMYDALGMSGGYISFQPPQLRRLPVCDLTDAAKIQPLEAVVEQLEGLHQRLLEVLPSAERQRLEQDLAEAEVRVNEAVYDLYGLDSADREVITEFVTREITVAAEPEPDDEVAV